MSRFTLNAQLLSKDIINITFESFLLWFLFSGHLAVVTLVLFLLLFLHGVNVFLTYFRDQACHLLWGVPWISLLHFWNEISELSQIYCFNQNGFELQMSDPLKTDLKKESFHQLSFLSLTNKNQKLSTRPWLC